MLFMNYRIRHDDIINVVNWMKRYFLIIWVLFICYLTFYFKLELDKNKEKSNEGYFWVFTDLHVDVLYRHDANPDTFCHKAQVNSKKKINRKYGQFDCDAPVQLLMSAFSAAKTIDSNIDFIIWLGDATSHISSSSNATKSVNEILSRELRKNFPRTLFVPVLGNHDIFLHENRSTRFAEFYNGTKYSLLLNDEDAVQTFIKGGYYTLRLPTSKRQEQNRLRFVVLNTAMFQPEYADYFGPNESIEQITWLNRTLSDAYKYNDRVLLLIHVPFGLSENLLYKFYHIKYEQQILSILKIYSSIIIMCLSAHRHQDIFRVYSSENTTIGIIGHPSISPISYLSQPSIRRYSYDRRKLILTDYDQYSLDLVEAERTQQDRWTFSYRFSSWYHQSKEITSYSLFQLIYLIRTHSYYLRRFLLLKHHAQKVILKRRGIIQTLCGLTLFNFDEFILCTRILQMQPVEYDNIIINNSLANNFHINEQLTEYRNIYRPIAFSLFIFIIIITWFIHRVYSGCFHSR